MSVQDFLRLVQSLVECVKASMLVLGVLDNSASLPYSSAEKKNWRSLAWCSKLIHCMANKSSRFRASPERAM